MIDKVEVYEHTSKDGKYLYDGVMTSNDLEKLIRIAQKNNLVGLSPNDYIAYAIRQCYDKNL